MVWAHNHQDWCPHNIRQDVDMATEKEERQEYV